MNGKRVTDNNIPTNVGEFSWQIEGTVRHLAMMTACGHVRSLPVNTPEGWQWDGNEDAPTLTPSILCRTPINGRECRHEIDLVVGVMRECGWHGHMTAGEMRQC